MKTYLHVLAQVTLRLTLAPVLTTQQRAAAGEISHSGSVAMV